MFEGRLLNGIILKEIVQAITGLITEANFECSKDGLAMQAMDSSHVSLTQLLLRANAFSHFECTRNISLGLLIPALAKIVKCAGGEDMITLRAAPKDEALTLLFESPHQTRVSNFSLKLMNIDSEHLGIPEMDYKCTVKMPSSEFKRIIGEMKVMGDTVKISADKMGVKFSVTGDMGSGSILCKQDPSVDESEDPIVIKLEEEVNLTFAMRYLALFTQAASMSDYVILKMSPDVPLVVEYRIGDAGDMGHLRFFLAPKIADEVVNP